jgi:hypothetical protein
MTASIRRLIAIGLIAPRGPQNSCDDMAFLNPIEQGPRVASIS